MFTELPNENNKIKSKKNEEENENSKQQNPITG